MAGFDLNSLLNGKSKAAVQTTEEETGVKAREAFETEMLDVEDLMPSKDNFYSTDNIDELAMSIELSGGIEQNLVVKPLAHGKYEVIAGHRRRLAVLKLVNEGKEEYRFVPCRIKKESDEIRDKLSLIFTNSTARQLTDWEKIQQAKELKTVLTEYKKVLEEENKDKPKEDRIKLGRVRDIVAQMLNTSTTQVGRMEAIDNNLSPQFKQELEKGNINISTAHELSKLDEDKQAKAYGQYEEKGELHIKDVKEETKPEITDEQTEWLQMAVIKAIKGEANHDIFKVKDKVELIEKVLRKHFSTTFKSSKIEIDESKHFIYRFAAEGITLIDMNWKNYLIEYSDLAEIVQLMIESDLLLYDDTPIEKEEENNVETENEKTESEDIDGGNTEDENEEDIDSVDDEDNGAAVDDNVPGQRDISNYPEYVPEPTEDGLEFTKWIATKYGKAQYDLIKNVVEDTVLLQAQNGTQCLRTMSTAVTNAVSVWVMEKTKEYQNYLQR